MNAEAEVTITTLCENRSPRAGLLGEHGLAMLLEVRGQTILFDTGAGATLQGNAETLGLDPGRINAVVLSHGHYDHTGGLETILKMRPGGALPVHAHPGIFERKYVLQEGREPRYIGLPRTRAELEALGAVFHLHRGPSKPGEGIWSSGEIPREPAPALPGPAFMRMAGDRYVEDPLEDDQALVVESSAGLVVMLGCTHAGLGETLGHILELSGGKRIHALLGGTHLLNTPDHLLAPIISALERLRPQWIAPCHCTGMRASCALRRAFGSGYLEHQAGSIFRFPR